MHYLVATLNFEGEHAMSDTRRVHTAHHLTMHPAQRPAQRPSRRIPVFLILLTLAGVLGTMCVNGALGSVEAMELASGKGTAPATTRIYWGAYIAGQTYGYNDPPEDSRAITTFESHTQRRMSILRWGEPLSKGGQLQP